MKQNGVALLVSLCLAGCSLARANRVSFIDTNAVVFTSLLQDVSALGLNTTHDPPYGFLYVSPDPSWSSNVPGKMALPGDFPGDAAPQKQSDASEGGSETLVSSSANLPIGSIAPFTPAGSALIAVGQFPMSAIPEPVTLLLLGAGLLGLAVVVRRQKLLGQSSSFRETVRVGMGLLSRARKS